MVISMRVCMLSCNYPPKIGGTEIMTYEIAKGLAQKGIELTLITCTQGNNNVNSEKINVINIPTIGSSHLKHISFTPGAFFAARKVISNADIIHSIMAVETGFIASYLGLKSKKPSVVSVVGGDLCDFMEATGNLKAILRPIIRWNLKNATCVHAISKSTALKAKNFGCKKIQVIPLGVDQNHFYPENTEYDNSSIISISRLSEKNGLDTLIRAMPLVLKELPEAKLKIYSTGHLYNMLMEIVKRNDLEKSVKFFGEVSYNDLPNAYRSGRIFVRPATDEGFGLSFLESMACGIPVIGTNVGSIPEIVKDKTTGLLVSPKQPDELAEQIIKIMTDDKLYKKLRKKGLELSSNFTWKNTCKELIKLYESMMI